MLFSLLRRNRSIGMTDERQSLLNEAELIPPWWILENVRKIYGLNVIIAFAQFFTRPGDGADLLHPHVRQQSHSPGSHTGLFFCSFRER